MKSILLSLLISSVSIAATMQFNIDVMYNKNKVKKQTVAQINANLNEEFSIENNGLKTIIFANKVTAKNSPISHMKNAYIIEAKVYEQTKTGNKLVGTPKIITKNDTEAIISVERDSGEYVEMKVTLKKI